MEVSIIITTYLRASELDKILFPSILNQSHHPFEILVIDDTPNNSVEKVCQDWVGQFDAMGVTLRYWSNPLGRSMARARRYGAWLSKNNLLMFLDSDVGLERDYIINIIKEFSRHLDAVGIQGYIVDAFEKANKIRLLNGWDNFIIRLRYIAFSGIGRILFGETYPSFNSCYFFEYPVKLDSVVTCQWLSGSNMTVKKDVFDKTPNDMNMKGYSLGEDQFLSRDLAKFGRLYITPYARCKHYALGAGRPIGKTYEKQERYFLVNVFGARGAMNFIFHCLLRRNRTITRVMSWMFFGRKRSPLIAL